MDASRAPKIESGLRCLAGAVLVAVSAYLVRLPGTVDVSVFWLPWTGLMQEHGWIQGYAAAHSDYPPGAFLFLHLVGQVSAHTGIGNALLLKIALAGCALASAAILLLWRRNFWVAVAFAFALLLNSAAHGYLDTVWLPPLLLCLWALESGRLTAAGALFALSVLIKWQPVLLAPFLAMHAARVYRGDPTPFASRVLALARALAGAAAVALPVFWVVPPAEILKAFALAGEHPGLSYQALNVNWIIQQIHYQQAGHAGSGLLPFLQGLPHPLLVWPRRIFYLLFALLLLVQFWRGGSYRGFLWYALTGFLTYCTVNNGVHENHLFLVMALAFVLAAHTPPTAWLVAGFAALTTNVNLFVFYGLDGNSPFYRTPYTSVPLNGFLLAWSALNFWFFILCWSHCLRGSLREQSVPLPVRASSSSATAV